MDQNRIGTVAAQARDRTDSRLRVVALFIAVLVVAGGLTRMTGPIEPPALDPQTSLVGP